MKNLLFVFSLLLLASCDGVTVAPRPGPILTKDIGSGPKIHEDKEVELDFSNPGVFMGSDFGNFFQTLYIQGEYKEMIKFTASESIELHGEEVIINHFKNMEFGYKIGKPIKKYADDYGVNTLVYMATIDATDVVVTIDIVIENDSCKMIVYQDLEDFPNALYKIK